MSTVIIATLSLQALASFDLWPRMISRPSWLFWPFLDYPMYREAHYEGEKIHRYVLFATLDDGREVVLSNRDMGVTFFQFDVAGLIGALLKRQPDRVAPYADLYARRNGRRLLRVRLEDHGVIVTRQEAVWLPPQVILTANVDPAAAGTP